MPELPEVEIIKRGLKQKIIGLRIKSIEVLNPKSFQGDSKLLIGATVTNVWRRAKILGIDLIDFNEDKKSLIFHLKMSGQLIFIGNWKLEIENSKPERFGGGHPTKDMLGPMPNKSTRVIFSLSSNHKQSMTYHLFFNDQRKFGWVKLVNTIDLDKINYGLSTPIGPEPLEKDFTWQTLKANLSRRLNLPIKVAIMDPSIVAGIGNIYANESCFDAGIDPRRKVKDLSDQDYKNLYKGIIKSLSLSITHGGSTKKDYLNIAGEKGYFLDFANVYDRKNLPCRICQTPIQKITFGGRGTYFCPKCQKS